MTRLFPLKTVLLTLAAITLSGDTMAIAQRVLRGQPVPPIQPPVQTSGCPAEGTTVSPPATVQPTDYVELQRTSCFGACPAYTVQIQADGHVIWKGERSVQVIGAETGTIQPSEARSLIEKFRTPAFWNLCSSYSTSVSDGATVITTIHLANQGKSVSNYQNSAPSWLAAFEHGIDEVANTYRWIHGDPRTQVFATVRTVTTKVNPGIGRVSSGFGDAEGSKPGLTPLMRAAARDDIGEIQKQLSAGADPNEQDSSGWTALMYATRPQDTRAMKVLLDAGANPNMRSYMGQTALMAVSNSYYVPLDKLRLLIAARADANAQDNDGHTTLMFAVYGALIYNDTDRQFLERADLISLLREAGARTDLLDASGLTVFDYLDEEARRFPQQNNQSEKLRQILQNPTPGTYPPVKFSGRVMISSGAQLWVSTIKLQRVGVGAPETEATIKPDGSFEFPQIQPGPYAIGFEPSLSFPVPSVFVLIPNKDLADFKIALPAIQTVSVRVAVEEDVPLPASGLIFVASSGAAARSGPPAQISADLVAVVPQNIQTVLAKGDSSLQLVRLGVSPLVDDATFRITLPSAWSSQTITRSSPLPDGSFRITLPEGEYRVAAILPRLRGGLPRIYTVKSLFSGSINLMSEPLKISTAGPAEIRATFGTVAASSWLKVSGHVAGLNPADAQKLRVILAGEIILPLTAPLNADASFEFPKVAQGRYVLRIAPAGTETAVLEQQRTASDTVINVTDKDITGIELLWRSR